MRQELIVEFRCQRSLIAHTDDRRLSSTSMELETVQGERYSRISVMNDAAKAYSTLEERSVALDAIRRAAVDQLLSIAVDERARRRLILEDETESWLAIALLWDRGRSVGLRSGRHSTFHESISGRNDSDDDSGTENARQGAAAEAELFLSMSPITGEQCIVESVDKAQRQRQDEQSTAHMSSGWTALMRQTVTSKSRATHNKVQQDDREESAAVPRRVIRKSSERDMIARLSQPKHHDISARLSLPKHHDMISAALSSPEQLPLNQRAKPPMNQPHRKPRASYVDFFSQQSAAPRESHSYGQ